MPDLPFYKQAVMWYVMTCYLSRKKHDIIKYEFAYERSQHFIERAANEVMRLTKAQKEAFIDSWTNEA